MENRRLTHKKGKLFLRGGDSQQGYALILTIAGLALLMLAGSFIGQHVSTALRLASAEKYYAEQERLARNTAAQIVYILATTRRSRDGVGVSPNVIKLDGSWYNMGNGAYVALQDARGLINLKNAPRVWKERLLVSYGIDIDKAQALLDALDDYVDADSLVRLQGAEADDYARRGMLPPRNLPLIAEEELLRVYGWQQQRALWSSEDGILSNVVAEPDTGINPNTATWRTLSAAFSIPSNIAKELVRQRAVTGIINITAFMAADVSSTIFSNSKPVNIPSATTVVNIAFPGNRKAWRFVMTITPGENNAPWRISSYKEYVRGELPAENGLLKLPDVSLYRVDIDKEKIELPF